MRSILSQNVRPRLGQSGRHTRKLSASPSRKSFVPPTRRKLSANDAFAILVAPVLGSALLVDTTWKNRQKHDWDQKLAQVEEEIEILHQRELKTWSNLQFRSVQLGARQQTRHYSALARASIEKDETDLENGLPQHKVTDAGHLTPQQFEDWTEYERLVALKMVLQMLLVARTGKSVTYRHPEPNWDILHGATSIESIVWKIRGIRDQITRLQQKRLPLLLPKHLMATKSRGVLDYEIRQLLHHMRRGQIQPVDAVYGLYTAIDRLKTSPDMETYRQILDAFSAVNYEEVAYVAMGAIESSQLALNEDTVYALVHQLSKYQDSRQLDKFLKFMGKKNRAHRVESVWEHTMVNDMRIVAPVSRSPRILSMLVRTALSCDQHHRAEAWAGLMLQHSATDPYYLNAMFKNFVHYFAQYANWRHGQIWLHKTLEWAAVLTADDPAALSRLVMRLLDLCVACDRHEDYETILHAALFVHLPLDQKSQRAETDRWAAIRNDWRTRHDAARASITNQNEQRHHSGLAARFQRKLSESYTNLSAYVGMATSGEIQKTPSAAMPNHLNAATKNIMGDTNGTINKTQVEDLRRQVATTRDLARGLQSENDTLRAELARLRELLHISTDNMSGHMTRSPSQRDRMAKSPYRYVEVGLNKDSTSTSHRLINKAEDTKSPVPTPEPIEETTKKDTTLPPQDLETGSRAELRLDIQSHRSSHATKNTEKREHERQTLMSSMDSSSRSVHVEHVFQLFHEPSGDAHAYQPFHTMR